MNLTIALICALFWFCFVFLVLYAKQTPEAQVRRRLLIMVDHAVKERMKLKKIQKQNEKKTVQDTEIDKPKPRETFKDRVITPILFGINERLQSFAPAQLKSMLENRIFRAGKQGVWNVKHLISFWVISLILGVLLAIVTINYVDLRFSQKIIVLILGGVFGAAFPFLVLNSKIKQRKREIKRQLPEFLDLLCVSVQAGLSFDGAISKMNTRMKGALVDEFKRVQSDVSLGMARQYALTQMARRCDLEEVYLFTSSIIQAEKLGTSMSKTLKMQADNMRERHRQYVKAEALKAPVKIIFPMVLFIFPSIFVVLLFPAIIMLMKTLGN